MFDRDNRLLVIKRKHPPFKGRFALPGGFVDVGETVEAAALRELREETGIEGRIVRLIGVYSDPKRDPRGHAVSTAFLIKPRSTKAQGGDDAASAAFIEGWRTLRLAFDHEKIVGDARR